MGGCKDMEEKEPVPPSDTAPSSPVSEDSRREPEAGNQNNAEISEPAKESDLSYSRNQNGSILNGDDKTAVLDKPKSSPTKRENPAEPNSEEETASQKTKISSKPQEELQQSMQSESCTKDKQPEPEENETSTSESAKSLPALSTDAFGEPVEHEQKNFGTLFERLISTSPRVLPRNALHASLMKCPEEKYKLQKRYAAYRLKKLSEYSIHPSLEKGRFEKELCPSCAGGDYDKDMNISKKLLEEDVPDYVLETLSTDEDFEKEIKNKTNHLYQQHVLVNGFMAKLFGKSLGKSTAFCAKTGKEELSKLYKLTKAYTLVVDVIHSMVTDNSLETWWQAFGTQPEDEPSYEEISITEEPLYEEMPPRGPLSDIRESDEHSSVNDEEIVANRKELDLMKIKLGSKVFEKKGISNKNSKASDLTAQFSKKEKRPEKRLQFIVL